MPQTKIFVINLARRSDRLNRIALDLQSHDLSFERIEAIDAMSDPLVKTYHRPFFQLLLGKRKYGRGPVANFLSFHKVWQIMVDENIEQALILEDDAKFTNWDERFLNLNIAQHGLDVLRLGAVYNSNTLENLASVQPEKIIFGRKLVTGQLWGNFATIITLSAAKKFLRHKNYWFPSDDYERFEKCFGIKFAIINPLMWTSFESTSDVELEKAKLNVAQVLSLKIFKPLRRWLFFPVIHSYLRIVSSLR